MPTLYEKLVAATDRDPALEAEFAAAIGVPTRPYMAIPIILDNLPPLWRFMWFLNHPNPADRVGEQCVSKLYGPQGQVLRTDAKHLGGAMCAGILKAKGLA